MDIPRAEDRGDGDLSLARMGQCSKCGMVKMVMNGILKCPSCDTRSTTKSGKVNHVKAAPASAFKKVKRKGLDGKEYTEMVTKSKAEMQKEIQIGTAEVQPGSTLPVKVDDSGVLNKYPIGPLECLETITDYFDREPAKSLQEFKRVDKLRKAIKKLRTQVEEYIGGK